MLVRLPRHDLHRERCSRCGKVFLTVAEKNWWQIPSDRRPAKLCPACELKMAGNLVGKLFKGKKR